MLAVADRGTAQAGRAGVPEWPGQRARAHTYVGGLTTEKFYFIKLHSFLACTLVILTRCGGSSATADLRGLVYSIENTAIY